MNQTQTTSAARLAGLSTPRRLKHESGSVDSKTQKAVGKRKAGLLGSYPSIPTLPRFPPTSKNVNMCLSTNWTSASRVIGVNKATSAQRIHYFSRYDEKCLLDEEKWYSVMPEAMATQIVVVGPERSSVGGNAIAFARSCERGYDTVPFSRFYVPRL